MSRPPRLNSFAIKPMATSARMSKQFSATLQGSMHYRELFAAVCRLILALGYAVCSLLLIYHFYNRGETGSVNSLAFIWILESVVHIMFVYANSGKIRGFLLDLVHLRVLWEFGLYVGEWWRRRNIGWKDSEFASSLAFESFFGAMPSLMVQSYVIITVERTSPFQGYAFGYTSLFALVTVIEYFKYLQVNNVTYVIMCMKAILSSAIRTVLTALLISYLGAMTLPYIAASWFIGIVMYWYQRKKIIAYCTRKAFRRPLHHLGSHIILSFVVSLNWLYVSYPFAPAYPIEEWWNGYLHAEYKMQIENILIAVLTMVTIWEDYDIAYFIALCIFMCSQLAANIGALRWLMWSVDGQLSFREHHCSSTRIHEEFHTLCAYLEGVDIEKRKTRTARRVANATHPMHKAARLIQRAWRRRQRFRMLVKEAVTKDNYARRLPNDPESKLSHMSTTGGGEGGESGGVALNSSHTRSKRRNRRRFSDSTNSTDTSATNSLKSIKGLSSSRVKPQPQPQPTTPRAGEGKTISLSARRKLRASARAAEATVHMSKKPGGAIRRNSSRDLTRRDSFNRRDDGLGSRRNRMTDSGRKRRDSGADKKPSLARDSIVTRKY